MNKILAVGIDIGTTTLCITVLDAVSGEILETLTRQNKWQIKSQHIWEKIQDAEKIGEEIEKLLGELKAKYSPMACIGVTGQMHGIVYTDAFGKAVSPLFTWQDGRGDLAYQEGLSYAQYLSRVTGYELATGFGMVTHFYNKVNGKVPQGAKCFCTIMDYITMRLSASSLPVIHPSNAASLGLFNSEMNAFDSQALQRAGLEKCFLPEIIQGIQLIKGHESPIPIAVAIGDNQGSFIGTVKRDRDSCLINIGTSSQISVYSRELIECAQLETRPLTGEDYILVGAPLCGGRSYALLETFFREIAELATGKKLPQLYPMMEELADDFEILEDPLEIATQFCGTRNQPYLRGGVYHLGVQNFTAKHFTVGVLQGMVNELYQLYLSTECQGSRDSAFLAASGNGIRMNRPLQHMISKTFKKKLHIPAHKEEASYGAALFALTAAGFFESLEEAQKLIRYQ